MKICVACGMPMSEPADFAMGDVTKDYCAHCARPDGTMLSYEEIRESIVEFVMNTKKLNKKAALLEAQAMMVVLPAWKDRT